MHIARAQIGWILIEQSRNLVLLSLFPNNETHTVFCLIETAFNPETSKVSFFRNPADRARSSQLLLPEHSPIR
jgi:hypothetical protein